MPYRSARRGRARRAWDQITLTPARTIAAAAFALAAAAGLATVAVAVNDHMNHCGPGVVHRGPAGECIGVTDGGYVFSPPLAAVEHAIQRENDSISGARYATVALLVPLTSPDPGAQAEIVHAVQGAYAAQYRANHESNGTVPPIRLVLANPGLNSAQWKPAVQQLEAMTGTPDNLRAVAGISVSTAETKNEVAALTAYGIPVVGAGITADDLANPVSGRPPFPGLARIAATNLQQAEALTRFGGVDPSQAVLVEDTRADDDYIRTLAAAFSAHSSRFRAEPFTFTSPPDPGQVGDTANTFANSEVPDICATGARWIYFAGRQVQLRVFLNALAGRPCRNRDFTVLTGDAAAHLAADPQLERAAVGGGITLEYTVVADPGAWTGAHLPPTGGSLASYQVFTGTLTRAAATAGSLGPTGLADGQAILNYDGVWTAVSAIRLATVHSTGAPALGSVVDALPHLNGSHTVDGASGWICLDNAGNPYDKVVPIVRLKPVGAAGPDVVALAWPAGSPPQAGCEVPPGG